MGDLAKIWNLIIPALVGAALCFAGLCGKCGRPVKVYIAAILLSIPPTWWALGYGENSTLYFCVYAATTCVILAFVGNIARAIFASCNVRAYTSLLCFAVAAFFAVTIGLQGFPFDRNRVFAIVESSTLAAAAFAVGFTLRLLERSEWNTAISLMVLWVSQALFRAGYVMNFDSHAWKVLNEFLPALFAIAAFGWIGVSGLLRESKT